MEIKEFVLAIVGTLCIIHSISCMPVPHKEIKHRFTRQSDTDDVEKDDDAVFSGIASLTSSSSKIIENLQENLESATKILRNIIDARKIAEPLVEAASKSIIDARRVAEPLVEAARKSLEAISQSKAIERTLETVATVGTAGIKASSGISALSRTGTSATPTLVQGLTSAGDIGRRVIRLAICTLVCPHQNGEEQKTCRKDNCGQIDKSDDLDEYDGDYVGIDCRDCY